MKTIINKLDNDWVNVKNKCRTTVGKEYTDASPTDNFKTKLLISEHSPIRLINVDWSWKQIKSWIATHWSRHKWECFIQTQRTDRTQVDRDKSEQSVPVNFDGYANAQELIDTMRKRLCYCTSDETRAYAEDLKLSLLEGFTELGEVLVPNCIYRCGCPEFEECGVFLELSDMVGGDTEILCNIKNRYDLYNEIFLANHKR